MDELLLTDLNQHLSDKSYISGYVPSSADVQLYAAVVDSARFAFYPTKESSRYAHITRWAFHISSFPESDRQQFPALKHTASVDSLLKKFGSSPSPPPNQRNRAMAPDSFSGAKSAETSDPSDLPQTLLKLLAERDSIDSLTVAAELQEDHQKVVGAINSLLSLPDVVVAEPALSKRWELTSEGSEIADNGSHEAKVFDAVPSEGMLQAELMKKVPNAKIGFSKAMLNGWIELNKTAQGGPRVVRKVDVIEDTVKGQLIGIRQGQLDALNDAQKADFKKRKLLVEVTVKYFILKKGVAFTTNVSKPETDLTADMLVNGSWREKQFKAYNFDALGVPPASGHLHPLMKVRSEFRQIFFEMGFTEMPTNRFVESSFWNFDTLFQPQQHPARDAHDTFFVSDPAESHQFPMDYLERVRKVHAEGGYGSQGYLYDWKLEEAKKNVMRTHTTAVSARQLYKLAQEGFKSSKLFSIDRVFRNETLDATHLAEFHQVEGVVAERGLSLAHVMGLFTEFFKKCGIGKLRFKPTYNPYTEPSMEIFAYHDGLSKWVEIGNSGMFRPEMLLPMGLPEDVNVAGFGLSLERPTMIRYGIENIRDLFGAKVNLKMVYDNPICRLDKQ